MACQLFETQSIDGFERRRGFIDPIWLQHVAGLVGYLRPVAGSIHRWDNGHFAWMSSTLPEHEKGLPPPLKGVFDSISSR